MGKKTNSTHIHTWILESPNGPTSLGTCRVCGQQRDFPNALKETGYSWVVRKKPNA